jgi:hypothetical protein
MKLLYQPGTILSVLKWLMGSPRAQRARWPLASVSERHHPASCQEIPRPPAGGADEGSGPGSTARAH